MKTMTAIIVEDEVGAANHLISLLENLSDGPKILASLRSIEEAVEWIGQGVHPNLAFFDIQLEDGLSFEIFKRCNVPFPVVFTTAFDEYAIEAFKVNSIDYLLKPVKETDLQFSLNKYRAHSNSSVDGDIMAKIIDDIESRRREYTLLIHQRNSLIPVKENEFAYFYLENGLLHGCTKSNRTLVVSQNIEGLWEKLDHYNFFRANRQMIVNRSAIVEAEFYFNGRLALKVIPQNNKQILVSKARVPLLKQWLSGLQ